MENLALKENEDDSQNELSKEEQEKLDFIKENRYFLDNLVVTTKYEKSYNHLAKVDRVIYLQSAKTIISMSIDGMLMIWTKDGFEVNYLRKFKAFTSKTGYFI